MSLDMIVRSIDKCADKRAMAVMPVGVLTLCCNTVVDTRSVNCNCKLA
jgi:hypothetical protein